MNKNVTKEEMTGLIPDTTYRVDCVAYHSDGVEYCMEANTTVTTRELLQILQLGKISAEMIMFLVPYAGPDSVLNVTIRGSTVHKVRNDWITIIQNITWEAPPNHRSIQHYVIKY